MAKTKRQVYEWIEPAGEKGLNAEKRAEQSAVRPKGLRAARRGSAAWAVAPGPRCPPRHAAPRRYGPSPPPRAATGPQAAARHAPLDLALLAVLPRARPRRQAPPGRAFLVAFRLSASTAFKVCTQVSPEEEKDRRGPPGTTGPSEKNSSPGKGARGGWGRRLWGVSDPKATLCSKGLCAFGLVPPPCCLRAALPAFSFHLGAAPVQPARPAHPVQDASPRRTVGQKPV